MIEAREEERQEEKDSIFLGRERDNLVGDLQDLEGRDGGRNLMDEKP